MSETFGDIRVPTTERPGGANSPPCSCGQKSIHVIMERTTLDRWPVRAFSNGDLYVGYEYMAHGMDRGSLRAVLEEATFRESSDMPRLIVLARQGRLRGQG